MAAMTYKEGLNFINMALAKARAFLKNDYYFLFLLTAYREEIMLPGPYRTGGDPDEALYKLASFVKEPDRKLPDAFMRQLQELLLQLNSSYEFDQVYRLISCVEGEWWDEYWAKAYDELLYKISSDPTNGHDVMVVPNELVRLVESIDHIEDYIALSHIGEVDDLSKVEFHKANTAYYPFAGIGSFIDENEWFYRKGMGQEKDEFLYSIGFMRMLSHDMLPYDFRCEDSVASWPKNNKYDLIISFPPFFGRLDAHVWGLSDWPTKYIALHEYLIFRGINSLTPKGRLVCILPSSFLHTGGEAGKMRRKLIDDGRIDTIIQLPIGLFSVTGVSCCVVVFTGEDDKSDSIRLVDGTSFLRKEGRRNVLLNNPLMDAIADGDTRFVVFSSSKEIVKSGYILHPSRYLKRPDANGIVIPDGFTLKPLSDIATISRGTTKNLDKCRMVRGRDLVSKGPITPMTFEELSPEDIRNRQAKTIDTDAILLLKVGQLKPTLFSYSGKDITLNPNVVAIRPNEGIDSVYLVNELRKDYVAEQVKGLSYGVIPSLSQSDLLSIKVLIPDNLTMQKVSLANEERIAKEQEVKSQQVQDYLERYKSSIFEMLSIRRHRIKPYLSGLSSNVAMLLEDIETSGVLQADQELFDGYNVKDALMNMKQNLAEVSALFKALTSEVDTGDEETIDLLEFLKSYEYSSKLPDRPVKVIVDSPSDIGDFSPIVFNKDNLREILDEIIFNAQKHFIPGFTDGTVALIPRAETDCITLLICNNGSPLPDGFDEEKSFTAGYFRDENGTGMGLFRVRQVCDRFRATIEWANDPASTMPVALRITFKRSVL